MPCRARLVKGQEMGWFEHGSTIIVFAPPGVELAEGIAPGVRLRAGQALLRIAAPRHRADTDGADTAGQSTTEQPDGP
jgi:putative intracellular protease/amidase